MSWEIPFSGGYALALGVGVATLSFLIIRDSVRRRGCWGINLHTSCQRCGGKGPQFRFPASFREALWGGWLCASCGRRNDKWGKAVQSR